MAFRSVSPTVSDSSIICIPGRVCQRSEQLTSGLESLRAGKAPGAAHHSIQTRGMETQEEVCSTDCADTRLRFAGSPRESTPDTFLICAATRKDRKTYIRSLDVPFRARQARALGTAPFHHPLSPWKRRQSARCQPAVSRNRPLISGPLRRIRGSRIHIRNIAGGPSDSGRKGKGSCAGRRPARRLRGLGA